MTFVKICGIKLIEDAFNAVAAGADYLGFNLYPNSVRFVEPLTCKRMVSILKSRYPGIIMVGIFVNTPVEQIELIRQTCKLDLVQLHGHESPETLRQLSPFAFKAFRGIPTSVEEYTRAEAPAFLLDAAVSGIYGGSGVTADWQGAARLSVKHDFFLAGGLTPANVGESVRCVRPWGVDVASGVESTPGIKDIKKMKALIQAVRQADEELALAAKPAALVEER